MDEPVDSLKRCTQCALEKPRTAFNRRSRSTDGLEFYCRSCAAILRKKNKETNPQKWHENNRRGVLRWAKRHREKFNAKQRKWYRDHPGYYVPRGEKRRARQKNVAINDFTKAQWLEMQAAYDHRCVYCRKRSKGKLTQDHITPLSKGGNHTYTNIVPACGRCNKSKNNGPVPVSVQPLLLLSNG